MSSINQGKARLLLGIAAVGTIVVLATTVLSFDLASQLFLNEKGSVYAEMLSLSLLFVGVAIVQLPFDLIGGFLIPQKYEKQPLRKQSLFLSWVRSLVFQTLLYTALLFTYLQIGRTSGSVSVIGAFLIMQVLFVAFQYPVWRLLSGQTRANSDETDAVYVTNLDHRFTGGVLGLPGYEKVVIPDKWRTLMSPEALRVLIDRRLQAILSGGRTRGIAVAILWNTLGLSLALFALPNTFESVAGIANVFFWFVLFSFLGLLILPSLNRLSVFQLDRLIRTQVGDEQAKEVSIEFDNLTEQDPSREASEESVFQPIPCPRRRIEFLEREGSQFVPAWNVARMTLYLGWAFGGPLSRSVHCNVGRPELWAIPPMD